MALIKGTNCGFVTVAPTADPLGTSSMKDTEASAFKDTSPVGALLVVEIGWYCDNATEEANYDVGIYSHDAGNNRPDTIIDSVSTAAKGTTSGWKKISGLSIPIVGSTVYWIGIQLDDTATQTDWNITADGTQKLDWKTSQTSLPTTWGASSGTDGYLAGVYALVEFSSESPSLSPSISPSVSPSLSPSSSISPSISPSASVSPSVPPIQSIAQPIKLTVTKEINGAWTADMRIRPDDYIAAETYVEIEGELYIAKTVKKIKSSGAYYFDVFLEHIMCELADVTIDRFYLTKSVSNILTAILSGSGWTAGTVDISDTLLVYTEKRTTVLEALNLLATRSGGELYFNSTAKTVDLKLQVGTSTKLQVRYDKNCTQIEKEEDSTELVTRIIPYGPDNFTINTTIIDYCEDETLYVASGVGTSASSTFKMVRTQGVQIDPAALNETFIRDLGAGGVIDLSNHTSVKFWIYSAVANTSGFTFGIGEAAYSELTVDTGALTAGCWHEITLDISAVANADKNAIRYIGFKNLTNGAASCVFDWIRAFDGNIYIDSDNRTLYEVNKEYVYNHSAKPEKTTTVTKIYPSDDAQVRSLQATTNFGNVTYSFIYNQSGSDINIAYMKFDLSGIPTGATITAATFNVYCWYIYGGGNSDVQVKRVTGAAWDEDTLTYNTMPAVGAEVADINITSVGWKTCDFNIADLVQNWWSTGINYGFTLSTAIDPVANYVCINTKEGAFVPYLEVTYTLETSPEPVIKAAAELYLNDHDEPKLKYKIKMVDLSEVMVDTWENETINLGDTVRVYDKEIGINTDCRVKKITKDLLDPSNLSVELTNKAYNVADLEAARAKQLAYIMPFNDNPTIANANAVQVGYLGSEVG